MHWKKLVKPDAPFFGEADFDSADQTFIVTIKGSKTEQIKSKKGVETHGVLYFEEKVKPLILNKTNGETIARLYGKHVEGRKGKQIMLYYDPNVYFGRRPSGRGQFRPAFLLTQVSSAQKAFQYLSYWNVWTRGSEAVVCTEVRARAAGSP